MDPGPINADTQCILLATHGTWGVLDLGASKTVIRSKQGTRTGDPNRSPEIKDSCGPRWHTFLGICDPHENTSSYHQLPGQDRQQSHV